jgi:hypothetical protein
MLITACFCMYNYNTVSGEASHIWHIATGHAMQVFNDLHYSNRCKFISIASLVAIASLSLNTVQCLYKNTKSGFVPIIVLTPLSRLHISQNNRLICQLQMTPFVVMIKIVLSQNCKTILIRKKL